FTKISLHEISAVTLPCNQDASIVSIKSADRGSRAADERLRDVLKRFARKHGLPANAQHMFGVVGGGMEGLIKTDLDLARRIERLERIEARGKRVKDVEYSQSPSGTFIFRKTIFEDGTSDVRVLTR
ncbi:MAG TPA: hypothetical protein VMF03_17780, partial [Steroidobacteraceae bacterium]|nr:hypothetical protein [Steroidobacteraceae bacterium]